MAFGEPVMDRSEQVESSLAFASGGPKRCKILRRAQLEETCILRPCLRDGLLQIRLRVSLMRSVHGAEVGANSVKFSIPPMRATRVRVFQRQVKQRDSFIRVSRLAHPCRQATSTEMPWRCLANPRLRPNHPRRRARNRRGSWHELHCTVCRPANDGMKTPNRNTRAWRRAQSAPARYRRGATKTRRVTAHPLPGGAFLNEVRPSATRCYRRPGRGANSLWRIAPRSAARTYCP